MVEVVTEVTEVVVVAAAVPEVALSQTPIPRHKTPSTRGQSIQIFQMVTGRGVVCTSAGGVQLIFVQSQGHVRGKISSLPSLQEIIKIRINEGPTSSASVVFQILTSCYTIKIYRKYIL